MRTSPRPENGAAGSAQSPQRAAGRAGPHSPGALGGGGSGFRAPAQGAAKRRWGTRRATRAVAALTVAFVSAAHSGRSRSRRRLRGSCRPHARSCAPRRARRFLAPPSTPKLARRRGGRRGALRGGRSAAPPHCCRRAGPAPCPACGDGVRPGAQGSATPWALQTERRFPGEPRPESRDSGESTRGKMATSARWERSGAPPRSQPFGFRTPDCAEGRCLRWKWGRFLEGEGHR